MSEEVKTEVTNETTITEDVAPDPTLENAGAKFVEAEKKGAEEKADSTKTAAQTAKQVSDKEKAETSKEEKKVVPEKYDLKLPEDSLLDKSALERIASEAKKHGLSNEEAQSLLERDSLAISLHQQAQQSALQKRSEEWVTETLNDSELGKTKEEREEAIELSKRAFKKFAPPEFVKFLEDSRLGNYPGLIKTFAKIGKMMGQDKLVKGDTPMSGKKSDAQIFYPDLA